MQKKINEMKQFFSLMNQKEQLENDIATQEARINLLRANLKNKKESGKGASDITSMTGANPVSVQSP